MPDSVTTSNAERSGTFPLFTPRANLTLGLLVLLTAIAGQLLIGTISLTDGSFHLGSPFHTDFVNYVSIARQAAAGFPPQNTAFAATRQTQPWLQFLPLTVLSEVMNPWLALRFLNVFYIALFMLILRKYRPDTWGLLSFLFLCTSSVIYLTPDLQRFGIGLYGTIEQYLSVNPASIDLLIRSVTHMPFFLLFLVAFLEDKRLWPALLAAFGMGWVHGMLALTAFCGLVLYLVFKRDLRTLLVTAATLAGVATYALSFSGGSGGSVTKTFLDNMHLEPVKPILHIYLFLPLFIRARDRLFWSLFAASFCLACVIQFNWYYFIFPLNLAVAFLTVDSLKRFPGKGKILFAILAAVGFLFFLQYSYGKYRPGNPLDPYAPLDMKPFARSLQWIETHTDRKAVFLIAPPRSHLEMPIVQEVRPIYLGHKPFVEILGSKVEEREKKAYLAYKAGWIPEGVDYVFYGPNETMQYPQFKPRLPVAYRDESVTIYDARQKK